MLDNFPVRDAEQAVLLANGRTRIEASGNMSGDNLRLYAGTGVDFISIGALTKHVTAIDLSLRLQP
jgi:nicotinate-nucleotide pyrophosphorylase (carboxylating)